MKRAIFGLVVAVATAVGCGGEIDGGPSAPQTDAQAAPGAPGPVDVSIDATCDALGNCEMVQPLLAGTGDSIYLPRGSVFATDVGTSSDDSVARIESVFTTCSCGTYEPHSVSVRSVALEGSCAAGEVRSCADHVSVEASMPGDVELVVADPLGVVFRRIRVQVRDVTEIELVPRLEIPTGQEGVVSYGFGAALPPAADGAIEIGVDEIVQVECVFRDGQGRALRFQRGGGFVATVEDRSVLAADLPYLPPDIVPRWPKRFQALKAASSRVTVEGRGVRSELVIRGVTR